MVWAAGSRISWIFWVERSGFSSQSVSQQAAKALEPKTNGKAERFIQSALTHHDATVRMIDFEDAVPKP
jgi:hypothetical protein